MPSLADQLAKNASLNAGLFVERKKRKPTVSYLFTGRDADQYDLETIFALGQNAFIQLCSIDSSLEPYEDILFSDQAKATDRTLIPQDAAQELDKSIAEFLALLGPYLMDAPTGKVIEWLVRRFRIYEFNIDSVMALFLPYHETPHFTKMVSILEIKTNSLWDFLAPYKSAAQNIQRVSLVSEMLRNTDVARFVTSLLPDALKKEQAHVHRTLLAFNAATLNEFIKRSKKLDEGTGVLLISALSEPLQMKGRKASKDAILGSYILLAALSQKCDLAAQVVKNIVGAMAGAAQHVSTEQFVSAVVAVCQGQEQLEKVSNSTVKAILRLPRINEEITVACRWYGSEKLLVPVLSRLVPKLSDADASAFIENLIVSASVPESVLLHLARLLANTILTAETALKERQLLSMLHQRHSRIVQQVSQEIIGNNEDSKNMVEELVVSISTAQNISSVKSVPSFDLIVSSTHADSNVRAISVKKLVTSLPEITDGSEDFKSIQSALLGRVHDSSVEVLEALYQTPESLAKAFSSSPSEYIEALASSVAAPEAKPKRVVLRLHLGFVVAHLMLSLDPANQEAVFQRILLPFLLYSKPRQHTAELVWEAVDKVLKGSPTLAALELLQGCPQIIRKDGEAERAVEAMMVTNSAIAAKVAENVLASSRTTKHLGMLSAMLQDEHPHSRAFGFLTMRFLLEKMSGSPQVETAQKALDTLNLNQLPVVDDLTENQDLDEAVKLETTGKFVVSKPSSKTTLAWLQIGLVSAISKVPQPVDQAIDWFKETDAMSRQTDDLYISGSRKVYSLLNNSGHLPVLALGLLQGLFASLKNDVLAFLAGIWTSKTADLQRLQTLALLQGAAFLEAHVQEADGLDFQTILPALLVGLQLSDPQSRLAALECIRRLRIISGTKLTLVYKFDVVYGKNSQDLQYLDQGDLQRYLEALLAHSDHFENDGLYLPVFHGHHLTKVTGDKKKHVEYKKHVLCYVLSHINAVSSATIQIILLQAIGLVTDKAKLQLLLPTVQKLLLPNEHRREELLLELLRSFNDSASKELNDITKPFWKVYIDLLYHYLRPDASEASRNVLAESLEKGLYAKLDASRQVELCQTLLELCSDDPSLQRFCKHLLTDLLNEVPVILGLLDAHSPNNSAGERARKRAKKTEPSEHGSIRQLSFLVEILGTKTLPGSIELISHLLQVLNSMVQNLSPSEAEVNYTEQLVMSAIESAANRVLDIPNLAPSAIRVDVLVELIRLTENPATFHQALLLMSNLTRLAPESVLHNVMPVFTFMGSNVFHRDDSYSFSVVQKTIDGIVPVMVSSLKRIYTDPLQLWASSKEFLHVFTDAVNHIPRHRRTKFFTHLVGVLGIEDFLAPMCMLLVEKVANRVARQSGQDVQSPLELPISLFNNAPLPTRIQSLVDILDEAQRLITRMLKPDEQLPLFLLPSGDADATSLLKRRAQSLIVFVGLTFNSPLSKAATQTANPDRVVKGLVALATLELPEAHQDIIKTSLSALNRLLNVMSAHNFIQAVSSMMEIDDERIRAGALDLLSRRLPDVSAASRQETSPSIARILANIKIILSKKQSESSVTVASLQALAAIGSTMEPTEQGPLSEFVPILLAIVEKGEHQTDAWEALLPLSKQLGPRIIPYFRAVVQQSVKTLKQGNADVVYSTLQALLSSIPTFWAMPEVLAVLALYIDGNGSPTSSVMSSLVKALTKRISAKVLLPSILDLWTKLQTSSSDRQLAVFFEVVSRTLRSADRPAILESLRALFKLFLDGLSILKPGQEMEANLIIAFRELVFKLNETAFRPLFRRLYDWAFVDDAVNSNRQIVFIHLYIGLQDYFKNIMNPYMSFLLTPYSDILSSYATGSATDQDLWTATVSSLNHSFINDDGGFWRDDKLRAISTCLIQQIETCITQQFAQDKRSLLKETLVSLVSGVITDDSLVKTINLSILMHTRSEETLVRLFALTCAEALWQAHGNKLLGFVAETATFIAECGEDENDMVVKESFKLKDAVERIAGKIDGL